MAAFAFEPKNLFTLSTAEPSKERNQYRLAPGEATSPPGIDAQGAGVRPATRPE